MLRKTLMIFSLLMVTVFLGLGILILLTGYPQDMPALNRKLLAAILLAYGFFRAYRIYKQYR